MVGVSVKSSVRHYQVALPEFQGPLDVLLHLIEKAQLDITKIALAQITDQFLAYVERMEDRSPEEVSAFLVVAARLLQIKSEALLPRPPRREEGEEDPGEALVRQLLLYRQFKRAAGFFQERLNMGLRVYPGPGVRMPQHPSLLDLEGLTLDELVRTARRLLHPEANLPKQVLKLTRVPIRELMHTLRGLLRRATRVSFFQWVRGLPWQDRATVGASFLAMLEIVRRREAVAHQPELFADIWLESRSPFASPRKTLENLEEHTHEVSHQEEG